MGPVRVLHIIGGGEIGGAEQHVLTLLSHLDSRRYAPLLACLVAGPLGEAAAARGLKVKTFPQRRKTDPGPWPQLVRWIRSENVTLLHSHGMRANLFGRLIGRWLGLPNISTVHSSLARDYLSARTARAAVWLDRLTLPLSQGQIVISKALMPEVAARGGKNIEVIYNGRELTPSTDPVVERAAWRRRWNIPAEARVVGNIARFHPCKGPEQLVQAAQILRRQFPGLHLLMIGEGPLRPLIAEQLEKEGIPFTLPGFLPQAERLLPVFDLFVLPSLSEGMGLVLLEAMQAGIPLVASHAGGIPELIRDGRDGLLVPPGEPEALARACAAVLSDPVLAASLVRSADGRRQEFTVEKMAAETERFYDRILGL
ncbi:alpha-D-kanosaminyltransferase [Peptococcaceae bacterium CEB3]|nr:alpha-D-kanosaminyltransferase [Peptococcaceae bacterium CEB3]